jgi:hypothetical protein
MNAVSLVPVFRQAPTAGQVLTQNNAATLSDFEPNAEPLKAAVNHNNNTQQLKTTGILTCVHLTTTSPCVQLMTSVNHKNETNIMIRFLQLTWNPTPHTK